MNLNLSGHHLEITPAIRDYVTSKLDRVSRHFNRTGAFRYRATTLGADSVLAQIVKLMRDAIPMKREGTADEVADAILWLCSDQSSYVTGSIIPVAGGRC